MKHIVTGTYTQPQGWTTPFSSWIAPGWWRWPPVMGSPSDRVPEQGPDWFLVATEACGGGTPDLLCSLEVLGHVDIYGCRKYVGGATGGPQGRGRALGGWARPLPRGSLVSFLTCTPSLSGCFPSKITSPEGFIPFRLRLIFLFFETLKQGKKQERHWALGQ